MDFLGLRNLTIISDALENIRLNRGEELDLERLELDDPASYDLLARGDTLWRCSSSTAARCAAFCAS